MHIKNDEFSSEESSLTLVINVLPGEGDGSCGFLKDLLPSPFLMSSSKDSMRDSHSETGVLQTLPLPAGEGEGDLLLQE